MPSRKEWTVCTLRFRILWVPTRLRYIQLDTYRIRIVIEKGKWRILFCDGGSWIHWRYIGSRCRINYTVQEHFPNYTRGNANEPTNQLKEDNMKNYYGRLKGKFKIMRNKYTLSKGKYKSYVGMCNVLTNYHILVNPLRDADGEFNKRYEQTSIDESFSKYTEFKRNRKVQQHRKKQKILPMTINRNGNVVTIGSHESIEEFNQNDNNNMLDNF